MLRERPYLAIKLAVANFPCRLAGYRLSERDPIATPPGALEVVVSKDTYFWENATRVGTGEVALPDPLADGP